MPLALLIPSISSGDVSFLTRIASSPFNEASTASSAVKYIFPEAAPGEAGSPFAIGDDFLSS